MKEEKGNLFEAFDNFWNAADSVRKAIKEENSYDVLWVKAWNLEQAMDHYEKVQDEHYPEDLNNAKTSN